MLKKILIGLALLVIFLCGLVAVLSFVAPTEVAFSREVVVNRSSGEAFEYVRHLKNQNEWGPWFKQDPAMKQEFVGTDGTPGFISKWESKEVGSGEQEIKAVTDGKRIDTELRFKEPFDSKADSYIEIQPVGENQSKIIWGMKSSTPRPFNVIGLVINLEDLIAADFEQGLTSLKNILETKSGS